MSTELKPCPFCGTQLQGEIDDGARFHTHPKSDCWFSEWEFDQINIEQWNRRAAPAAGTVKDAWSLLREARATLEIWKDVAPAVSLCADIDAAIEAHTKASKVLPCRNQIINSGAKAWPRSCPRCGLAKDCPAGEVIEAHNARSPSCGT